MEIDIPRCTGCGEKGAYLCRECQQPEHEVEAINQNIRHISHNDY